MNDALRIASIGLEAQRTQLDTIAQNVSNVNTPGYKRARVEFSSLLDPGTATSAGLSSVEKSSPNAPARVSFDLSQGELRPTESALDIAISGAGFIEVTLENGKTGLIRGGSLVVREDGQLATRDGLPLKADIRIPEGAGGIEIARNGDVIVRLRGESNPTLLGRISLVAYASTETLEYLGQHMFAATEKSGNPTSAIPGEMGLGVLRSGFLEASNVKIVDEMVSMMLAQRVYGLNSKVAQVADEMMSLTNNLRRS
jgi:flagellar basal-body rod protein FlgG